MNEAEKLFKSGKVIKCLDKNKLTFQIVIKMSDGSAIRVWTSSYGLEATFADNDWLKDFIKDVPKISEAEYMDQIKNKDIIN